MNIEKGLWASACQRRAGAGGIRDQVVSTSKNTMSYVNIRNRNMRVLRPGAYEDLKTALLSRRSSSTQMFEAPCEAFEVDATGGFIQERVIESMGRR